MLKSIDRDKDSHANEVDWVKLYFSSEFQALVEKLVHKRFGQSHLSDSAKTHLLEVLFDENKNKLSSFQNKGSAEGYLKVVVRNEIESFAQSKLGKKVPPTWLKEKGGVWVNLWRELCLQRRERNELLDRFSALGYSKDFVIDACLRIKARISKCGMSDYVEQEDGYYSSCEDEPGNLLTYSYSDGQTIESTIQRTESEALLSLLAEILSERENGALNSKLQSDLKIDTQTTLIMKMRLVSGLKISQISKALNLTRYQIEKELQLAFEQIRKIFSVHGVDLSAFQFIDRLDDL